MLCSLNSITVEPQFNEVAGDWVYLFVRSSFRYIVNLDITNLAENDQNVPSLYRGIVGLLLSGHPRDFKNWPLNRGWPFN